MRSVQGHSVIGDKDEQDAGVWTDERYAVYTPDAVWVGLCWGDRIVAAVLPVAYVVYMASGAVAEVVPGAVVAEACPLDQRGTLRWLPRLRILSPY